MHKKELLLLKLKVDQTYWRDLMLVAERLMEVIIIFVIIYAIINLIWIILDILVNKN